MKNHQIKVKLSHQKHAMGERAYKLVQLTGKITLLIGTKVFRVGDELTEAEAVELVANRRDYTVTVTGA